MGGARSYPIVALGDSGWDWWTTSTFAEAFATQGGERMILLCGTAVCDNARRRALPRLRTARLNVTSAGDRYVGHAFTMNIKGLGKNEWAKFVAGVPGWEGYPGTD